MDERDRVILRHIGLYRLTFRRTLDRLYFAGATCNNVVQRLRKQGLIQERDGLPGRLAYYQLTAAGAASAGVPKDRAEALAPAALHKHIAILHWCCMGRTPRHRVEPADLEEMFGGAAPSGDHVLQRTKEFRLFRVHVVTGDTDDNALVRRIVARVHECRREPALAEWLREKQYGFVALVEAGPRRDRLDGAVQASGVRAMALVHVKIGPGPLTIGESLHAQPDQPPRHARRAP
jgi:hypothetical protein